MKWTTRTAAGLLLLAACGPPREADEPARSGAAGTAEAAPTNRMAIPATVRRNLGITFARVEARRVDRTLRVPGAFELRPRARHEYRMALAGRVELLVDQYQPVERGHVLFRFQSPVWPELLHEIIEGEQAIETARAEIEVARATLGEARSTLELLRGRVDALAEAEFRRADLETEASALEASLPRLEAELGLAETLLANAQRTREHALHRAATSAGVTEAELEREVVVDGVAVPGYRTIDWVEVRAVEDGVVEHLHVTDGAFVEPPGAVLSTVDPRLVRFRGLALQSDLAKLMEAEEARIVPPQTPDIPIGAAVSATMTIGLEAHPLERTVSLLATPGEPASWIRPGVSAFLEVVVQGTGGPRLAIPRSAVVRDGLTHVLFRRDPADPDQVVRVEADLGLDDGRWVVVNSGVGPGDEVVLAGAYELQLASQESGATPKGGHFHADGSYHGEPEE